MDVAMQIFEVTRTFPAEERYSLVDQIRRSSRSVCANIAEAWRKRRYKKAFISKLSDAEAEAGETLVWLRFAERCGYLDSDARTEMDAAYRAIIAQVISMIDYADKWTFKGKG
jgi:four helix bundle protein